MPNFIRPNFQNSLFYSKKDRPLLVKQLSLTTVESEKLSDYFSLPYSTYHTKEEEQTLKDYMKLLKLHLLQPLVKSF